MKNQIKPYPSSHSLALCRRSAGQPLLPSSRYGVVLLSPSTLSFLVSFLPLALTVSLLISHSLTFYVIVCQWPTSHSYRHGVVLPPLASGQLLLPSSHRIKSRFSSLLRFVKSQDFVELLKFNKNILQISFFFSLFKLLLSEQE